MCAHVRRTNGHNKTSKLYSSTCIGIITIPHMKKIKYGSTHIMKTYIDWFEDRGVRVIPIPYDTTQHEMYFNIINGLLIPGGETEFIMKNKTFVDSVTKFFELSLQQGEYFPIWGTCFGFELLMCIVSGSTRLKRYPARGLYPLHITRYSRMFTSFPNRYLHYLEHNKSTLENHEFGISPDDFLKNHHLRRFYDITATSIDDNGKQYIAAIEAKTYPVYGVQWHPERQKNMGYFVDFFISELKKNKHNCKLFTPSLRIVLNPHKCIQYPEHKNLLCYFF